MKVVKSRAFKDRLRGHKEAIIALSSPFGETGYLLLSASKDGSIRAWDLVKRTITNRLLLSRHPGKTLKFLNQDSMTDAEKKSELKKQQEVSVREQLSSAAFTESHVFAGFDDGFVCSWEMANITQQTAFAGHEKRVTDICILGEKMVTGSADSTIRIWHIPSGEGEVIFKVGGQVNRMRLIESALKEGGQARICALVQRNVFYLINMVRHEIEKSVKFG